MDLNNYNFQNSPKNPLIPQRHKKSPIFLGEILWVGNPVNVPPLGDQPMKIQHITNMGHECGDNCCPTIPNFSQTAT
jgi:hypothetical protein